jgi:VanZ family protein
MVLISYLSLASMSGTTTGVNIPNLDKLVHFTFYFVATILGGLFLKEISVKKVAFSKATFIMMFVAIFYGMVIEILQYSFTADRHGDVLDFLANSIGAISGYFAKKQLSFK